MRLHFDKMLETLLFAQAYTKDREHGRKRDLVLFIYLSSSTN